MSTDLVRVFSIFGVGVVLTFVVGFYSLITTRNLLRALIGVEILTKATTLLVIVSGYVSGQIPLAQALVITLIIIEVVVIAVAVGVVLCIYRHNKSLDATFFTNLKG